ncbi:MAG: DUF2917 domain-containing protein [Burkholderiaceae bacterium]|nr:DUF2917 domain-containing protein [Sulfuritalea sp.]MCF8174459.1 DUF2917 domain-containing protein [Burkholderiaceae bacterium]MCF8183851.1 DUF2917 domain-containing protein [Polynucleobacter sp.]
MDTLYQLRHHPVDLESAAGLEIVLHECQPLRLVRARGQSIACRAGRVWITAPGVTQDIFLHPGAAWEVSSNGLVLVEALDQAVVVLLTPATRPEKAVVSRIAARQKSLQPEGGRKVGAGNTPPGSEATPLPCA